MMNTLLLSISLPVVAYLLGSIPFGLLFVRLRAKTDIRDIGSGNIGTTNVKRVLGTPWAVATLICDVLKGFLPALAALYFFEEPYLWLPAIVSIAAICGHIYPIYLRFKPSGKGVATTLGCLLVIAPFATLLYLMVLVAAIYFSRRVSVGSLAGALLLPPAAWFTTHDPVVCATTIWIMVWILIRHKENIERLASGVEPAIRFNRRKA
ncbi:MAG: glycerol-3-phosphate 1-O-acyltransferase PlsY [Desulfobacteraceae bacterium]